MVFDVKKEDFRHKARLVAGGHMTEAPGTITYASVVLKQTVRIAFMIAAPNDEVKLGDILNFYVQTPVTEKVWTTLGPEFGKDPYIALNQWEQLSGATLLSAWNHWCMSLARLTQIYDLS